MSGRGSGMAPWGRWLVAVAAALAAFAGCVWVLMAVRFSWMPDRMDDRWLPALGIATFAGTVIFGPLAWWAGREGREQTGSGQGSDLAGPSVVQVARASGHGRVNQAGRDLHTSDDGK